MPIDGVYGVAVGTGDGVYGVAGTKSGVAPTDQAGVFGDSTTEIGVIGTSADATGVYGVSVGISGLEPGVRAGVWGDSTTHAGVVGTSNDSVGVAGYTKAAGQAGVLGADESSSGAIGGSASSSKGTALQVAGVAKFSRSGLVSIATRGTSATVTDVSLSTTSLVLANLHKSIAKVVVEAVVPDVSGSSFEIFLSKPVPTGKTASIAWFVVN